MRARRVTLAALTTFGAAVGLVPATAHADPTSTIYVNNASAACSDAAGTPGTAAQPFCSIYQASQVAVAGQTVLVEPGTYSGGAYPQYSGTADAPIVFKAAGPGVKVPINVCGGGGDLGGVFDLRGRSYITIQGFDITACDNAALDAHNGTGIVFTGNTVHDTNVNTGSGGATMVDLDAVTAATISGNTFTVGYETAGIHLYNGSSGATVSGNTVNGAGTMTFPPSYSPHFGIASTAPDNKIVDNVVRGMNPAVEVGPNGDRNLVVQNYAPCDLGGVLVSGANGVSVTSNTVVSDDGSLYTVSGAVSGVTLKDNIGVVHDQYITCNPRGTIGTLTGVTVDADAAKGGVTMDYNALGIAGASYQWAGSYYANPTELAAAGIQQGAHDLIAWPALDPNGVPVSGSAPVDSADPTAPGFQATDILGHPRYDDANTLNTGPAAPSFADRGAFEYQGVVNPAGPPPFPPQTPPTPPVVTPPSPPTTGSGPAIRRIAGVDRYSTGVFASMTQWAAGQAKSVVLARGGTFPDALSGVPLAAHQHGPLLLTDTSSLSPMTATEIRRVLGTDISKTVYILGGTGAVSPDVEKAVRALGYNVVRYGGADRFATALQVAQSFGPTKHVVVATGQNFPDALSAGPLGAVEDAPIVLSDDKNLDPATAAFVASHAAIEAVGGQADGAVKAHVGLGGKTYQPLWGDDRYLTSKAVAQAVVSALGHAPTGVGLASGMNFPDALTGGAYAANAGQPLLLTDPAQLPGPIGDELGALAAQLRTVTIFGGVNAVSKGVEYQVAARVHGH